VESPGRVAVKWNIEPRRAPIQLSIVVPVYNSEKSLPSLVVRMAPLLADGRGELILVDDASRDASWEAIRKISGEPWSVRAIRLMRNSGQHAALLAGIRAARGEIIITMDDDLQHPPEEVPKLLEKLAEGFDVVYGTPRRLPHSVWRNLASWTTKIVVQRAMGAETARQVSAFRAFRTSLRDAFAHYYGAFVSIDVLLTWGTTRFAAVPVEHRSREVGRSNYTFRTLIVHALTMVTGFSTLPLRLASLVGFCFTLVGLLVLGWVVGVFLLRHGSVPGFPFLASIIAIFSGAQLFALGIVGEYLARMHVRTMGRPPYTIAEEIEATPPA